jgi:hypothetical protein
LLQIAPGNPIGYVLRGAPAPSEGTHFPPERQRASRLLTALAARADSDGEVSLEPDADAATAKGEAALIDWLIDAGDASAGAFLDVLTLVRESQAAARIAAESALQSPAGGT